MSRITDVAGAIARLREAVEADPRPQREIAAAAGMHASTFNRLLAGRRSITVETLLRVCAALDLAVRITPGAPRE